MKLDVAPFELALSEPLGTASGEIDHRRGWLVRVRGNDVVGIGEATPLPGWTESHAACRAALDRITGSYEGDTAALVEELEDAPAARHGVALAELDRRARERSVPLHEELHRAGEADATPPSAPASIPVNATLGDADPGATVAAARRAVEAGFECLKLKVGARDLESDRRRLEAVREAVGEDIALRADANGAWDRSTAETAIELLAANDVELVEQPLPAADLTGMGALRGRGVSIAADESLRETSLERILAGSTADAVVCKPMVLGGPDRAVSVARTAREHGLQAVVTTTVDAVVARTAAVHAAAALAPIDHCGLATAARLSADLADDPAPVEAGSVHVPTGSGTDVDHAQLSAQFD